MHIEHPMGFVWQSLIPYEIRDQFNKVLPKPVPVTEHWTSGVRRNVPGSNWERGPANGSLIDRTVPPDGWADSIAVTVAVDYPDPEPVRDPLSTTLVDNWLGEWYVGSQVEAGGVRVQTNRWLRYLDHGLHGNRLSPAP